MLDYYLNYDKVVAATDAMTASIPSAEMDRDIKKYPRNEHSFDRTGANLKSYASTRANIVRAEISLEFGLGQNISVRIASTGRGKVLLDGMTLPSNDYTGRFFEYNDIAWRKAGVSMAAAGLYGASYVKLGMSFLLLNFYMFSYEKNIFLMV